MRRKMLRWLALGALMAAMLARPRPAYACTCGLQYGPPEAYAHEDAVFIGTVTLITDMTWITSLDRYGLVTPNYHHYLYRRASLVVNSAWKGVATSTVTLRTCGYPFAPGTQYLIYAHHSPYGLETDVCTRTRPVPNATADLAYLQTLPHRTFYHFPLAQVLCVGLALAIALSSAALWRNRRNLSRLATHL
jgi:hypothetical protein